jgi:hypothetical protein
MKVKEEKGQRMTMVAGPGGWRPGEICTGYNELRWENMGQHAERTGQGRIPKVDGYEAMKVARQERRKPPPIADAKLVSIPVVRTFDEVYAQWTNSDVNREDSRPLKDWTAFDLKGLKRGVVTVCIFCSFV